MFSFHARAISHVNGRQARDGFRACILPRGFGQSRTVRREDITKHTIVRYNLCVVSYDYTMPISYCTCFIAVVARDILVEHKKRSRHSRETTFGLKFCLNR